MLFTYSILNIIEIEEVVSKFLLAADNLNRGLDWQ